MRKHGGETMAARPHIKEFFDQATWTLSYIAADPDSGRAAIIDPVLDFDAKSGRTATRSAEALIAYLRDRRLTVDWILETHAHADHLTAAPYLKEKLGGRIAIGEHIATVQATFKKVFNAEPGFATDGSQFDYLFKDGETFAIGGLKARVIHTPGHTPACVSYAVGDAVFVGDTLFMPDYGTARCDFPGGDPRTLYRSMRKLLALPPDTRLFMCHDYQPSGRPLRWETSVAEERARNIHVHDGIDEDAFVELRTTRDKSLDMPALLLPSVQVNMRAGRFPPPEANGVSYLKLPLNAL
jgi:glyoxylase-like metal-dependent hydrolase (beta-lactamase superfamily II)